MSKFLLLLGPSGVGKSMIIQELIKLDNRFTYISPYITRSLRDGEKDKISVSDLEIDNMNERGELLVINPLYGIRYATPRKPIIKALSEELFPVLDWPIDRMHIMIKAFPEKLYSVYIIPPSIEILSQRLSKDKRDLNGDRLESARIELEQFWSHKYVGMYDIDIVSKENDIPNLANFIYISYLKSFNKTPHM